MQALKALGLPTDIPVRILLSDTFNDSIRVLTDDQKEMVGVLREVVERYNRKPRQKKPRINSCQKAVEALGDSFKGLCHEECWAAFLGVDLSMKSLDMICRGSLDYAPIDCRRILSKALAYGAAGVIIFHNHPSGNPQPSAADTRETERIREAGKALGIEIHDHIIVAEDCYYSFANEKVLKIN